MPKYPEVVQVPANNSDGSVDGLEITPPYVCVIARAIGHHIARQHYSAWEKTQRRAANDNSPASLEEEIEGQCPKG